ncbi:hypothetical protein GQ43DRAFT_112788 [Delitschia confertaspora ATCC 74209]|uniref:EamA domain-containing protein n=1 Tax=Delitschia confertaspora ATCC 74209 TaxID=1513339 RepID=A0A9P4JHJ1_9PLEO|nr:hypothetical protein GQ43DRAFT_112788 [Delitschia confertaspora ATCC 74209]
MPLLPTLKPAWLWLAIASGACAAFNGVFAKLTTTELTGSWAGAISRAFSLSPSNKIVEFVIRGLFFGLNLLFNATMWGLFTKALTSASSTVRVSVINTSANFMITAILGVMIFSESLPALWLLGAAMLVAGSVIIGRREEEGDKTVGESTAVYEGLPRQDSMDSAAFRDEDSEESEALELASVKDTDEEEQFEDNDPDAVLK